MPQHSVPVRSNGQTRIRTAGQVRQTKKGSMSQFGIVCARQPLWGFGTFVTGHLTSTFASGNSIFNTTQDIASPSGVNYNANWYNPVWPYVYNNLTETWTESWSGSGGSGNATQTIATAYSQYADVIQTAGTSATNPFYGTGIITSVSCTSAALTIHYTDTIYPDPAHPLNSSTLTGTYTAALSGSLLNPAGAGPFNPTDPTYGWAALTSLANTLLGYGTIPNPGSGSSWVTIEPTSGSPGYTSYTNAYDSTVLYEYIAAAAYGLPASALSALSSGQTQFMPPTILDWPTPSPNRQPAGASVNQGSCLCLKSTWNLNGAGWGNPAVDPGINNLPPAGLGQVMNDHAKLFAQTIDLANFNTAGSVNPASTFPNPIAWPQTITFNPSDVTANIGAGHYGVLGFQPTAQ